MLSFSLLLLASTFFAFPRIILSNGGYQKPVYFGKGCIRVENTVC